MVNSRRVYQRLKGIRSSLKTEISKMEKELKKGDLNVQSVKGDNIGSLLDLKTKLRKQFDRVSKKGGDLIKSSLELSSIYDMISLLIRNGFLYNFLYSHLSQVCFDTSPW